MKMTMTVYELRKALERFDPDLPVVAQIGHGLPLQPVSNPQGGEEKVYLWCTDEDEYSS